MSENTPADRAARRTRPLTRDEIMATALAIVDEQGVGALSMRAIAGYVDAPIRADDAAAVYPAIVGSGITPWAYDEAGYRTALGVIIRGFGALGAES